MVLRLMLASALALATGAAVVLLAPQEPPTVRAASRAEYLAAHPQPASLVPAACAPVQPGRPAGADI